MTKSTDSNLSLYLSAIQNLKEDDFSKEILKPLFESMSFSRVDFVGGPYEAGKDLIALHEVPLKGTMVYAIQTKKIGVNSNTSDKRVLSDLIVQLRQCFTKKITLHNGNKQIPDAVYLASPFQVNQRLLDEIHELLGLDNRKVEILDGPKVVEYIKKFKPALLEGLLNIEDKLQLHDVEQLNNLELISALNQRKSINELNCYCDLAFFMGTIDSNILLGSTFSIRKERVILTKSSWDLFNREILQPLESLLGFTPLTKNSDEIEEIYNNLLSIYTSKSNLEIRDNINQAQQLISSSSQGIRSIFDEFLAAVKLIIKNESSDVLDKNILDFYELLKTASDSDFLKEKNDKVLDYILKHNISNLAKLHKKSLFPKMMSARKAILDIESNRNELDKLKKEYVEKPDVNILIDHEKLLSWINNKCEKYKKDVFSINNNENDVDILLFLTETQRILNVLDLLINPPEEGNKLITIENKKERYNDGLSISPFKLFNSKHDIAVYGGAGAGKTTTLQMYVRILINENNSKFIYIPLNRYINQLNVNLEGGLKSHDSLIKIILISKNIEPTSENVLDIKMYFNKEKKMKLILDGLDEAYAKYPGIIQAINGFKTTYPQIQMLISSRDCVSYLSEINFLGITLLPFNESQLYKFIRSWFETTKPELGEELINSIQGKEVADIVKTPLLATLLCDLAEKGVDIPSSESEIFTKRLELFCGLYDTYKDIKRTELSQSILHKAAIKIAYLLHERNRRSATKSEMIQYLINDTSFNYEDDTCTKVVSELIDPCNIIVFDAIAETYSFGHLRYQEHLASIELQNNRSIEIVHYLKNDWWRGVLCLYAQCCDFQSLIEEFTHKYNNIGPALITLREMVKYRPIKERKNILNLLDKYESADSTHYSIDDYNYNDRYYNDPHEFNFLGY
ncbi:NACHT domain-containing NTPase [Morganella morganii]|uniref:NACHT domain-containing protein n=1 Tax=Morganella morganii TaxID=582 RepID=UPI0030FE0545